MVVNGDCESLDDAREMLAASGRRSGDDRPRGDRRALARRRDFARARLRRAARSRSPPRNGVTTRSSISIAAVHHGRTRRDLGMRENISPLTPRRRARTAALRRELVTTDEPRTRAKRSSPRRSMKIAEGGGVSRRDNALADLRPRKTSGPGAAAQRPAPADASPSTRAARSSKSTPPPSFSSTWARDAARSGSPTCCRSARRYSSWSPTRWRPSRRSTAISSTSRRHAPEPAGWSTFLSRRCPATRAASRLCCRNGQLPKKWTDN